MASTSIWGVTERRDPHAKPKIGTELAPAAPECEISGHLLQLLPVRYASLDQMVGIENVSGTGRRSADTTIEAHHEKSDSLKC